MNRSGRAVAAVVLLAVGVTAGCSSADYPASTTLTVLTAASAGDVVELLGDVAEGQTPGLEVRVVTGGSGALVAQVQRGAPADVLVTASADTMAVAEDAGDVQPAMTLATNEAALIAATTPDPPVRIVADLTRPGVALVICDPSAPCGVLAEQFLAALQIPTRPVSLEPDARAVLTKVRLGEADAGVVYRTDALTAGSDVLVLPTTVPAPTSEVCAAVVAASPRAEVAQDFLDLLGSAQGAAAFADAGFLPP